MSNFAFRPDLSTMAADNTLYCSQSDSGSSKLGCLKYFVSLMSTMPDHNKSIDDMVAEGDKVVIRYTVQGTQKGAIFVIPATGKHVSIKACDIYKIEGGKIMEWWEFPDYLGGMIKAGIIFSAPPKT